MNDKTRLFFVVSSKKINPEIFDNYEDTCELYNKSAYDEHPVIAIYYEDLADTFKHVTYL
jgi:hypothetical protein